MKAGDCVNVIFPRVLSSSNEVSVRFSQVIPTRRGSPARFIPSTCLGCQGNQIKVKVWVMVSNKPPGCCRWAHWGLLLTSQWHWASSLTCWANARNPRAPRCSWHWMCSRAPCRNLSCHASLQLARLVPDVPLPYPSCPASLCRFHLASPSSGDVGWAPGSLNPTSTKGTHQELLQTVPVASSYRAR